MPQLEENTYILNVDDATEMARLMQQDRMVTKAMGGVFPEVKKRLPNTVKRVLDVGCGPGGWPLDVAHEYARIEVVGVDVSNIMIQYARARARSEGRKNARFMLASILKPLEFPDDYFDIVNMRFMIASVHRDYWPSIIADLYRITRPGGIIRWTETDAMGAFISPATRDMFQRFGVIGNRLGYGFAPPDGVDFGMTPMLGKLLKEVGCQNIHHMAHALDFSYGTEGYTPYVQNLIIVIRMVTPIILRMGLATQDEIDDLINMAGEEMASEDFRALWYMLTAWGKKP